MEGNMLLIKTLPCVHVLMYHSISDTKTDPWDICVSPGLFEEHIQFLQLHFKVISITELIEQLLNNDIPENAVCVTFDDGYADNYVHAKPVLEKYNCAATFFIPTAFINNKHPFWWDVLELIFLQQKKLPALLMMNIYSVKHTYAFCNEPLTKQQWLQHQQWKWYAKPPTERCRIFLEIWNKLRPLPYTEIQKHIDYLIDWAGVGDNDFNQRLPMNEQQLIDLSASNLFTVGMHTHSHVDLQSANLQIQLTEITYNKNELLNKYNIEGNCLAYPYGRYNDNTFTADRQLKMAACFTTNAAIVNKNSKPYELGRFQVFNQGIEQFDYLFAKLLRF